MVPVNFENDSRRYKLIIRQSPVQGVRLSDSKITWPLEPPLIAQLIELDQHENELETLTNLEPILVAHLSLLTPIGDRVDYISDTPGPLRLLHGDCMSNIHVIRGDNNKVEMYFVFPKVGIAQEGRFCIQINVFDITRNIKVVEGLTEPVEVLMDGVPREYQRSALVRYLDQHGVSL